MGQYQFEMANESQIWIEEALKARKEAERRMPSEWERKERENVRGKQQA